MRKNIILALLALLPMVGNADLLSEILRGDYKAQTLSTEQQDSILNGESEERYQLTYENRKKLFRHSFEADWYIVDKQKGTRKALATVPVRDAILSANNKYIAYAVGNKLHLHKLDFGTEVAITPVLEDMEVNEQIFEGVTDWTYEEEFDATAVMAFSPDSKQLAFLRLDETNVPSFDWQEYLPSEDSDAQDADALYPRTLTLRYPKAGASNAKAEVCVYDIASKAIKVMALPEQEDSYLPRLTWAGEQLMVLRMNRDQNKMEVFSCNPKSTVCHLWYKEESRDYYVDYSLFDEWQWLSDGRALVVSEKSGWKQAYLYSAQGMEQKQLTQDGVDVMHVYGIDEKTQTLYYLQADQPETRTPYAMNIKKGSVSRLSTEEGMHSLRFSKDWSKYIDCYESTTQPNCYTLHTANGKTIRTLEDNANIKTAWEQLNIPEKEWFTFTTERGDVLHGWVLAPSGSPLGEGKCPVVFTQYSGPNSQRVVNRWRKTWDYYLAEQGYMVVCVDGRGTGARGRKWRNETYMNLGEKEAQDQLSAAKHVATWANVDADRIAMVGWSYGGFQVLTTMSSDDNHNSNGKPVIKAGIAIAPVTDWRLYDSAYTERYMRRPQVNDGGYNNSSLLNKADRLQGELLIVHGLADDNVHVQNTLLYTDALVQAGKQFDMQLYVDDNHHLRNRANYEHMHRRLMRFLEEKLKQ